MNNKIPLQLQAGSFAKLQKNKKDPLLTESWQQQQYSSTDKQIKEWDGNIGFICGTDDIRVIDIEGPKKGNVYYEKLKTELDKLNTFTISTPSGGRHYFIKNNEDYEKAYWNLDIGNIHAGEYRARDCYVATYPSKGDGWEYKIENDVPIKKATSNYITQLMKVKELKKQATTKTTEISDESKSGKEYREICRLQSKAKKETGKTLSFEDINNEMQPFLKWTNAHPQYKQKTYDKATAFIEEQTIKENTIDIPTKTRVDFSKELEIFNNTHSHLPGFKMIEINLGLQGDEYYSIKKYLNYFVESLRQPTISFHVGTEPFDNRTHFATMIDPGHGKGKIKSVIKTKSGTSEINGSRTHIEQLIGKKIVNGKGANKTEIDNKGYFGCVGLVMDESQTLLCEEQSHLSAIMVEIRKACDPYMYNITEKKQVDNLQVMKYPPETRFSFLTHPVPLPALFFDLGTYRRMFCFQIKKNEKLTKKQVNSNFFASNKESTLKEYINTPGYSVRTLDFQEEQTTQVLEWVDTWRAFTLNHPNQRVKTLGLNSFFSIPLYFFRLVAIASSLHGEITPTKKIIDTACFDCTQFLLETFQIYANKSQINLSRSIWETEDSDTAGLLEWIWFNKGNTKETTPLSIEQVQDKIQDIWGVWSERQAKRIYSNLKEKGYLNDYHSAGISKCWLAFEPRIDGNINLEDYPKVDLINFLKKAKHDIGDMDTPISVLEINSKIKKQKVISSTYNPNTTTTTTLTLNDNIVSPMSSPFFELIDGDLPERKCSSCNSFGKVVAEKLLCNGIYIYECEKCFEGSEKYE